MTNERPRKRSTSARVNREQLFQWRVRSRERVLRSFVRETTGLAWSPALLRFLLEELHADEAVGDLMGDPATRSVAQYPQLVAVALAYRHSWRVDDLHTTLQVLRGRWRRDHDQD